jgi:hypothetical protein
MSDNFIKGTSDFTKAMLYGSKTLVGMGLNLLKNTLPTYMAVYKGTLHGNLRSGGGGGGMFGSIGKKAGKFAKGGARMAGRTLPAIGAVATTGMSIYGLMDDDKSNDASSVGGLIGSGIGAAIGTAIAPGIGTLIGISVGNMAGSAIAGMLDSRNQGTTGATGMFAEPESILTTVDKGEKVLSPNDTNTLANLNFNGVEKQLSAIAATQAAANKIHSQHLDSVNTSLMLQNKTRIASETIARKRYEIGNV